MFAKVAEIAQVAQRPGLISATSESTSDTDPYFYEDLLRLLVTNIEGKITEFLNV